jgi:hypothetical protein
MNLIDLATVVTWRNCAEMASGYPPAKGDLKVDEILGEP